jgi:flagellar hook-associated protein 2
LTRGVGGRLDQQLAELLDPVDGRVQTAYDGFAEELDALQLSIDRQNEFFSQQQQRLIDQFTALESVISQLQTTGNFLTAQLSNLPTLRRQ